MFHQDFTETLAIHELSSIIADIYTNSHSQFDYKNISKTDTALAWFQCFARGNSISFDQDRRSTVYDSLTATKLTIVSCDTIFLSQL